MNNITVDDVISQIDYDGKIVTSRSTGKEYTVSDFVTQICSKLKFTAKQKRQLENYFSNSIKAQSEKSRYVEEIINKYDFKFSDGVYIINNKVIPLEDIYRLLWKEERLLPTEADEVIENIEKISQPIPLQTEIFESIKEKSKKGRSKYLDSLYSIYPSINWHSILYNILVPNTKPLFHIFYDNGMGGTGKSTLLEVLTKIVGNGFVSNVLLDQFSNRFIFSNMLGKYLNIGDDNGKNDELQNVGTLKSIITNNRVTIDRKNISPIEVRIFAKQLFATNILPYIDFTDGGIMRRLNIVEMSTVIPKDAVMPIIDDDEVGHIVYEVLLAHDLNSNSNKLAVVTNPLYRFYKTKSSTTYIDYKNFCDEYGFKKLNIINFETKSRFIKNFIDKNEPLEEVEEIF